MKLGFSAADEAFRAECADWLNGQMAGEFKDIKGITKLTASPERRKEWEQQLAAHKWSCIGWPEEWGGRSATLAQQVIFAEEYARAGVPGRVNHIGVELAGPTILAFGSDEQKRRFLPDIAAGKTIFCQGFSEPGAGSDLASVRTKGRLDPGSGSGAGGEWVVNGQKIWTSYADKADWIFCLVRTDKTNKYQGISFLLFDMASPGVSTKPILLISGNSPFCETFFDNVEVPKHQIVGELNRGWDVAKYLLGHEREMISATGGGDRASSLGSVLARTGLEDPVLRAELAQFDVDALAFSAMSEKFMDEVKIGRGHPAQPNMMKYAGTELNKRRYELLMAGGGSAALEWDSEGSDGGTKARSWLRTKANSIEGGTSEVMLGVISKRILDLPGA